MHHEESVGLMRLRIKRHRWYKRILKANDPLVFSIGWRRFQSCPLFSIEDQNERHRYLKYSPEHMHCHATIYGPVCPPNTGVLAYQSLSNDERGFRMAATGIILELDHSFQVVKKLKLIGTPEKIFKHTAIIKGMFNSELEVAKFEGASIQTVSGIRGSVKKAQSGGNGSFRASFEDKILKSGECPHRISIVCSTNVV
jgi:ribosome biogenesis protein BMS1